MRPGQVRGEVRQVGVRVAVLLAGDLRARHLVQELDGSVGQLRRLQLEVSALRSSVITSARSLWAYAAAPSVVPRTHRPARSGETRSSVPAGHVIHARVDFRVEVAEALGHRLDRLVVGARTGVELLGAPEVAGLDGGRELARAGDELLGLVLDVAR